MINEGDKLEGIACKKSYIYVSLWASEKDATNL